MKSFWTPLLLADPSPCLRLLVLRTLLGRPDDDAEVRELLDLRTADPLVTDLLAQQHEDGSWSGIGSKGVLQGTAQALLRLGYLGFDEEFPPVQRAANFLFAGQQVDGSWPLNREVDESERYGNYDMIPLQTAVPLRGLAACGYGTDPRAERAYEWLLNQRLEDGAWPTGLAGGNYGYVAGYRRLAHSRWGCRSNTTGVLLCLAHHPHRRHGPEARRALDLLLGRETRDKHAFGFEVARIIGAEPARGLFTYFARFDAALVLDLCWRIGASQQDERVERLVNFAQEMRGAYSLWQYDPRPQTSRWLTFDLLRSLSRLDEEKEWISLEPRTPFRSYGQQKRRY